LKYPKTNRWRSERAWDDLLPGNWLNMLASLRPDCRFEPRQMGGKAAPTFQAARTMETDRHTSVQTRSTRDACKVIAFNPAHTASCPHMTECITSRKRRLGSSISTPYAYSRLPMFDDFISGCPLKIAVAPKVTRSFSTKPCSSQPT
jgi:hypothetical protein